MIKTIKIAAASICAVALIGLVALAQPSFFPFSQPAPKLTRGDATSLAVYRAQYGWASTIASNGVTPVTNVQWAVKSGTKMGISLYGKSTGADPTNTLTYWLACAVSQDGITYNTNKFTWIPIPALIGATNNASWTNFDQSVWTGAGYWRAYFFTNTVASLQLSNITFSIIDQ